MNSVKSNNVKFKPLGYKDKVIRNFVIVAKTPILDQIYKIIIIKYI